VSATAEQVRFTYLEWLRIFRGDTRDLSYQHTRLGPHVREYLAWKRLSRARPRTLDQYERDLARLCLALPDLDPRDVSAADLMLLLEVIPEGSWKRYRAAWGGFFRWCCHPARRLMPWNPIDELPPLLRQASPVYDLFTQQDLDALASAAARMPCPRTQRLRVLTLTDTGIRADEAVHVQLHDYDLYRKKLRVTGKGGKQRLIHLTAELGQAVDDFRFTAYPTLGREPTELDFVWHPIHRGQGYEAAPRPEKPLGYRAFLFWWGRVIGEAGVRYRHPHMLRHTLATDALDATGGDLYAVKEILGHASTHTTEVYLHSSRTRTESAIVSLSEYRSRQQEKG